MKKTTSPDSLPAGATFLLPPLDDRELARFHRPQPPTPIPERRRDQPEPGLLARQLLGARVHTRGSR